MMNATNTMAMRRRQLDIDTNSRVVRGKMVETQDKRIDAIRLEDIEKAKEDLREGDIVDLAIAQMDEDNYNPAAVELVTVAVVKKYPHIFRGDDGQYHRYDQIVRGRREFYDVKTVLKADSEAIPDLPITAQLAALL